MWYHCWQISQKDLLWFFGGFFCFVFVSVLFFGFFGGFFPIRFHKQKQALKKGVKFNTQPRSASTKNNIFDTCRRYIYQYGSQESGDDCKKMRFLWNCHQHSMKLDLFCFYDEPPIRYVLFEDNISTEVNFVISFRVFSLLLLFVSPNLHSRTWPV